MSHNPDIYLLYEYMDKIPLTVRIKVQLDEKIDAAVLTKAAQEAITRYPYFSVQVGLDEGQNYTLEHNDRPIAVLPEKNGARQRRGQRSPFCDHLQRRLYLVQLFSCALRRAGRLVLDQDDAVSVYDREIRSADAACGSQARRLFRDRGRALLSGRGQAAEGRADLAL